MQDSLINTPFVALGSRLALCNQVPYRGYSRHARDITKPTRMTQRGLRRACRSSHQYTPIILAPAMAKTKPKALRIIGACQRMPSVVPTSAPAATAPA